MALFIDRHDAGTKLARKIESTGLHNYKNPIVLGIPRGGIAIGEPVAEMLKCPLDAVTLRKLPLPQDSQMGFGAINIDREVILNQEIVSQGLVTEPEIGQIADSVYREVLRRDRVYRKNRPFPKLEGRHAIIVDDGLATGYTMLAAVRFARGRKAHKITVAVPVAHEEAYSMIKRESDSIICIYIDHEYMFAVANFYDDFSDMSEEEIVGILEGVKAGR